MSKPVDNVKYAVTKPTAFLGHNPERAFDECLVVVRETKEFVYVVGSRWGRGPQGSTRVSKRSVMFYTDHDISEEIRLANNAIKANFENHMQIYNRHVLMVKVNNALPDPSDPDLNFLEPHS